MYEMVSGVRGKVLDPELADTLKSAGEKPVEAVFMLRFPKKRARAQETRRMVDRIVGRAETKASRKMHSVAVFENLHSFAVRAPAPLIKELANAREVQSARLNRVSGDVLIRPVNKKRVPARNLKTYAK